MRPAGSERPGSERRLGSAGRIDGSHRRVNPTRPRASSMNNILLSLVPPGPILCVQVSFEYGFMWAPCLSTRNLLLNSVCCIWLLLFFFLYSLFLIFSNFSTWCYLIEFWRCWVVYEPATLKWHVYGSPWRRSISIGGRNVSFRWETPGVMNIPRLMNSMRFSGWQYEALTWIYEFMRALDSAKRVIEKPWNESQQNCQWTFNRFRPRGRGPGKMSSPGIH